MTYRWTTSDVDSVQAQTLGLEQPFETQAQAEEWLSAFYDDLADGGVSAVSLMNLDRVVYGPMSLAE